VALFGCATIAFGPKALILPAAEMAVLGTLVFAFYKVENGHKRTSTD
jgi:hypothetical protein